MNHRSLLAWKSVIWRDYRYRGPICCEVAIILANATDGVVLPKCRDTFLTLQTGVRLAERAFHTWERYAALVARAWNTLALACWATNADLDIPPLILADYLFERGIMPQAEEVIREAWSGDVNFALDPDQPYPFPLPLALPASLARRLLFA